MNLQQDDMKTPFDKMAPDYDLEFTNSLLGRIYRNIVWERMDGLFTGKRNILELGCGTGEDSLYLARQGHRVTAIDASEEMIEQARIKIEQAGLKHRVELRVMDIEKMNLSDLSAEFNRVNKNSIFDGVTANFGVLNCVDDITAIAAFLHKCLAAGSPALFSIMGPAVPWEWLWYLLKGQPAKGFRRLRKNGVYWRGITVRYPGIRKTRRSMAPFFRTLRISALGCFLPPSYAKNWAKKHPAMINVLHRMEQRCSSFYLAAQLADHFILEMEHVS